MNNIRKLFLCVSACLVALTSAAQEEKGLNGQALDGALKDAKTQLKGDYHRRQRMQERMNANYEHQHRRMMDVIKRCNELSMSLYLQKKENTFDLSHALEEVTDEYKNFNQNRRPYDRVIRDMDVEIDRYARLLESLRRLPPALDDASMDFVPDSLRFRNDSLESHLRMAGSSLEKDVEAIAKVLADSASAPFVLSRKGQAERDTCIFYASELLKMYVESRSISVADSTYYREAYLRLRESYDYAKERYDMLQKEIFIDGEIAAWEIISRYKFYLKVAQMSANARFGPNAPEENRKKLVSIPFQTLNLLVLWLVCMGALMAAAKLVPPVKKLNINKQRRPLYALLAAIILFIFLRAGGEGTMPTFLWLLAALVMAILIRLKPEQLKYGAGLYLPTIVMTLVVIWLRESFMPNVLMNILFPPVLAVIFVWQLMSCLANSRKADSVDVTVCWASLSATGVATAFSVFGYVFLALMILVWWYFQLAAIMSLAAIWHLLKIYKDRRMEAKVEAFDKKITYVSGEEKKTLMFGATWFYDLVHDVIIPVLGTFSLPLCLHYSLDIFDFDDLYYTIYKEPFFQIISLDGKETFRFSLNSVVLLVSLFFIFKYVNKALHTIWHYLKYTSFLRKNNRKSIRTNEINLSLGNSVISILVWFVYALSIIQILKLPTGSLGLVAGGLSAGIGLALKDIINNFIYGIQLMSGRLRVGDWIECDGVRGRVSDINYQSTLVETTDGTQVAFLNTSLFGKNFNNLTRGNSYEFVKIVVGVSYGTDVDHVREVLERDLEVLKTKDKFGRDVVDPRYGIYVRFANFGDSAVEIAVKQFVLVPEKIGFVDMEKELIYKSLNNAGISIPFPQRDIHIVDK